MSEPYRGKGFDYVAGIDARGFILGGAIALALGTGFVPIRKRGKLPHRTLIEEYELEYGQDAIEIHVDAITEGDRVLLVDDLIATGGTAEASIKLLQRAGATVVGAAFIIGGALGNMIDRVRLGYVVDFFDFSGLYFPWVFNVADICIDIGIGFLLLDAFLTRDKAPKSPKI